MIRRLRWILDIGRIVLGFVVVPFVAYASYVMFLMSADCAFAPLSSILVFFLSVDACLEPLLAIVAFQPNLAIVLLLYVYVVALIAWLPCLFVLRRKQWLSCWRVTFAAGVLVCVLLAASQHDLRLFVYVGEFAIGMLSGAFFWLLSVWRNPILVKSNSMPTVANMRTVMPFPGTRSYQASGIKRKNTHG